MIISPIDIIRFQSCPRRWMLERSWRVVRPRPKALLDSCLREGVVSLSSGADIGTVRSEARARLMSAAADPGMAVPEGVDPYPLASDLCATLDTSLTAISRLSLLRIEQSPMLPLPGTGESSPGATTRQYSPLSLVDESGVLHRWLTVDAWDDDTLTRELHSWVTVADMAVVDAPMTLHVVVVGSRRDSRQVSPWTRAYDQPLSHQLRFSKRDRRGVAVETWPVRRYADMTAPNPEAWVDAMIGDGVMPRLLLHPAIAELPSEVRRRTLQQLHRVVDDMDRTVEKLSRDPAWQLLQNPDRAEAPEPAMALPMSRGACHGMVECPWVSACYRPEPEYGIGLLGEYSRRVANGQGDGRRGNTFAPSRSRGTVDIPVSAIQHAHAGSGTGG